MLTYKTMELSDVPQLVGMYVETFNAPPWNDGWTEETAGRRLHQMINVEDFFGLCTYQDGILCEMILGCMEQYYDRMIFSVREFCVSNQMRGQGLGTEIFRYFERKLKEAGVDEILLYTLRSASTIEFYCKQGMEEAGELVLMRKRIRELGKDGHHGNM